MTVTSPAVVELKRAAPLPKIDLGGGGGGGGGDKDETGVRVLFGGVASGFTTEGGGELPLFPGTVLDEPMS